MPIYAVTYTYADDSAAARDTHRPAHRAYLATLSEQGINLVSGPFGADEPPVLCCSSAPGPRTRCSPSPRRTRSASRASSPAPTWPSGCRCSAPSPTPSVPAETARPLAHHRTADARGRSPARPGEPQARISRSAPPVWQGDPDRSRTGSRTEGGRS
ncbi:hypothetical protein ACFQVA_36435 [Actinomadura keratinilytica]